MAYPSTFLDIQTAVLQKARLDATLDSQRVKERRSRRSRSGRGG